MRNADTDGDGTIDKNEFAEWFRCAPFWRENYDKLARLRREKEDKNADVIAGAFRKHRAAKQEQALAQATAVAVAAHPWGERFIRARKLVRLHCTFIETNTRTLYA